MKNTFDPTPSVLLAFCAFVIGFMVRCLGNYLWEWQRGHVFDAPMAGACVFVLVLACLLAGVALGDITRPDL